MANISDQLAADIHTAFAKYFVDLANQDQIFFGVGNVTITRQDGSTATVPSWNKVVADNGTAIKNINTNLRGIDEEISTISTTLGKGARKDLANTFSEENTFSKLASFKSSIDITGSITATGASNLSTVELRHATPFIDFHYGNSTADYTHRIIADDPVALKFDCSLNVTKNIRAQQGIKADLYLRAASRAGVIAQFDNDPGGSNGQIRVAPQLTSQFATIGSDSNGQAGANLWMEEDIGTNHRLVTQLKGYGAPVQYWHHRSDGQIWNSARGDVAWAATSDRNLKHDIQPTNGLQSLKNIQEMELVTFVYNDDEQGRQRRGIIAQQLQTIDPCYVKTSSGTILHPAVTDEAGKEIEPERLEKIEKLVLDTNPLLMDAISAVKYLAGKVEQLENTIAELKSPNA